jgi:hypothetical protein
MANLGSLVYYIQNKNAQFKRGMRENQQEIKKLDREAKRSQGTLRQYSAAFKKTGMALTAFGAIITGVSFKLAKMASDANEIQSRFNYVFGEMSKDANKWAEDFADSFNQSTSEIKSMMATLQDTLVPMGVAEEKAFTLNKTITQLAIDMSSFANVPLEQAMNDIQSAIVGQSRPMRKYGSVLTETRVKANALKEGIIDTDRELTEQEKILSRVNLMMQDMSKAQGDYKRTQDSFANRLRETRNLLKNIGEEIGTYVLPQISALLSHVQSGINWFDQLPAPLKEVISQFAVWSGIMAGIVGPLALFVGFLPQIAAGLSMVSGGFAPFLIGGAVIAGVTKLVSIFNDLNDTQDDNLESTKNLVEEYENLSSKENKSKEEKNKLLEISQDLADLYPDAVEGINDETEAYELNTEKIIENAKARNLKSMAQTIEENIDRIEREKEALNDQTKALKDYNDELKNVGQIDSIALENAMGVISQTSFVDQIGNYKTPEDFIKLGANEQFQNEVSKLPKVVQNRWNVALETMRKFYNASADGKNIIGTNEQKIKNLNEQLLVWQKRSELINQRLEGVISNKEFEKRMAALAGNKTSSSSSDDEEEEEEDETDPEKAEKLKEFKKELQQDIEDYNFDRELKNIKKESRKAQKELERERDAKLLTAKSLGASEELIQEIKDFYEKRIGNAILDIREKNKKESLDSAEDYINQRLLLEKEGKEKEIEQVEQWFKREKEKHKNQTRALEELRELRNQKLLDIEEEYAEKEMQLQDEITENKYEAGKISLEEYINYLKTRLKDYKKMTDEWVELNAKINDLEWELGFQNETTTDFYGLWKTGGSSGSETEESKPLNWLVDSLVEIGYEVDHVNRKFKDWQDNLITGLSDAIARGESLGDVFKNLANQISSMVLQKAIVGPMVNWALGGIGLDGIAHSGGLVTVNGVESLDNFHVGGTVGGKKLRPDEKVVKTKVGELILTEDQQRGAINAQGNGGDNVEVYQINSPDAQSFQRLLKQNKATIVNIAGEDIMANGKLRKIMQKFT